MVVLRILVAKQAAEREAKGRQQEDRLGLGSTRSCNTGSAGTWSLETFGRPADRQARTQCVRGRGDDGISSSRSKAPCQLLVVATSGCPTLRGWPTGWCSPSMRSGATDAAIAGGKGANLGALLAAGFRVPSGFVLTTAAYGVAARSASIDPRIRRLPRPNSEQESCHRRWRSQPAMRTGRWAVGKSP